MNSPDPVLSIQRAMIAQIVANETWYEGERRGCAVHPDDPVVRYNVCIVVLRCGGDMREESMRRLASRN